jgi:hypothetical protein
MKYNKSLLHPNQICVPVNLGTLLVDEFDPLGRKETLANDLLFLRIDWTMTHWKSSTTLSLGNIDLGHKNLTWGP